VTLLRRIALFAVSFLGITIVTFSLLGLAGPAIEAADEAGSQADPGARSRAARLAERYALDQPLFFNPDPPDAATRRSAGERRRVDAALGVALPDYVRRILAGDDAGLARGLDILRKEAGFPSFGTLAAVPDGPAGREVRRRNDSIRRDFALWWRRHENEWRERSALWRATIGRVTETRYAAWLGDLVRLDLGDSVAIRPHARVLELLRERLPPTILVMAIATVVLFGVGVPLGLACAWGRGTAFDRVAQGVLFVLHATPEFWVATICLVYLASDAHFHLFPVGGLLSPQVADDLGAGRVSRWSGRVLLDLAHHLVLPVAVLVFPAFVVVVRHVRAAAIEALGSRFVTALRARGIPERRIVFVHALRSCAPPAIVLFTSVLPGLVTGSILIEVLFSIEGMGHLSWQAATLHDFPVGMAILTLVAVVMLLAHVLTDVLHGLADRRVRAS
jgi:ABC-type dipeptide/oligopeptide/nickel transport system permease component